MQKELNLTGSTCKKYMESLKRVIHQARKENYLNQGQMEFMFDDIKIRMTKPKRTFLEPEEIKKWRKIRFTKEKEHLQRDRDLFLFQIYTGYYYKDLQIFNKIQLTKDQEYGYFIIGARDKNDNQTIIPLFKFPNAQQIIEKYSELNKLFPNLHDQVIQMYPSGDNHIIVEFVSSGTAPDSSKFELPICTILTIENGMITKDFTYFDNFEE